MNEKFLNEIYKSQFADGFKQSLKEKTPEIVQLLQKNFGEEKTDVIIVSVNKIINHAINKEN